MNTSVYAINKGINKSIEFRGLQAQYIWYFAAGVLLLMIIFSILYILGLNTYLCLLLILIAGVLLTQQIYRWSHQYGAYGMMKMLAHRKTPKVLKSYSRKLFHFQKAKTHAA